MDTCKELQLVFTSNIRLGGKMWSHWLLVSVFLNLLISWDFPHTTVSGVVTQNGAEKPNTSSEQQLFCPKKHPVDEERSVENGQTDWLWCDGVGNVFSSRWSDIVCMLPPIGVFVADHVDHDHVRPFMATVYHHLTGYRRQDDAPCHSADVVSDWFHGHDREVSELQGPLLSPDVNPAEPSGWDWWQECAADKSAEMIYGAESQRESLRKSPKASPQHLAECVQWRTEAMSESEWRSCRPTGGGFLRKCTVSACSQYVRSAGCSHGKWNLDQTKLLCPEVQRVESL